jgi:hypothetical protein
MPDSSRSRRTHDARKLEVRCRNHFPRPPLGSLRRKGNRPIVRKLIAFDDDTFDKLKQLGRDRMATIQELADEAFADVLKKHGIPIDLKDALRKSASLAKSDKSSPPRKRKS